MRSIYKLTKAGLDTFSGSTKTEYHTRNYSVTFHPTGHKKATVVTQRSHKTNYYSCNLIVTVYYRNGALGKQYFQNDTGGKEGYSISKTADGKINSKEIYRNGILARVFPE